MPNNSTQRLFLIDGMAQVYRSHFAMSKNPLITRDGRHTSAIFGFMNMLFKLIRDENPDYLAIVMDSKAPTFRHKLYTDYKATRERMPDELIEQIDPLYRIIQTTKIPIIAMPGFEADDILGTLAKQADQSGYTTYIVTGDKDMMQLVTESTFIYSSASRFAPITIYDREGVKQRWGVSPEQIVDFLTLLGDSSDNIPGVDGIGKVGAAKLLNEYGTLDEILNNIENIPNKRAHNGLINARDIIHLSKELATIVLDVPVALHVNEMKRQPMDVPALIDILEDLEMFSLIPQIESVTTAPEYTTDDVSKDYRIITSMDDLRHSIERIVAAPIISFDLETTSVNALEASIVGMSFSIQANKGWYIPVEYPERENQSLFDKFSLESILQKLKPVFEDIDLKFCGQNIKYDALVLSRYGINLRGIKFDTMVAAHLIHPESGRFKIDYLSIEFLNYRMIPITDLIGSGKGQKLMSQVPIKDISYYAVEEADVAFQLTGVFSDILRKNELEAVFQTIEMPLIPVLIQMEKNGIYLDLEFLQKLSVQLNGDISTLEKQIYQIAGCEFNLNSTQQLAEILFDQLQLKTVRKRSTDVNVLAVLKHHHSIPGLILDYRHLKKLVSTYIDAFPEYVNPTTGRVHTSLNQTIAATGRLSSTRPNFQNIPIRTELGKEIRKAFRASEPGWKVLSADYSQIELRVMAHFCGEPRLIDAFRNDEDIHARTASTVFGVPIEAVSEDQRRQAKVVNFGIMYGAGPYRMSQELNIPINEARELIASYFATYPGIQEFIDSLLESARQTGYVKTLFGRRRYTKNLSSERTQLAQAEERAAINMPIQGTAAEIIKIAMCRIHEKLIRQNLESKMILQVHDELIFEVPPEEVEIVKFLVLHEMENAVNLLVPLKVTVGVGDTWYDAH